MTQAEAFRAEYLEWIDHGGALRVVGPDSNGEVSDRQATSVLGDMFTHWPDYQISSEPLHVEVYLGSNKWDVYAHQYAKAPDPQTIEFDDGSQLTPDDLDRDGALDQGPTLLQPITILEFASLEKILAVLWEALDNNVLSDVQCHQIRSMADLISSEQRDAEPGATPRWKLVAAVRGPLRFLLKELPRDLLAWYGMVGILHDIRWHELASEITRKL